MMYVEEIHKKSLRVNSLG